MTIQSISCGVVGAGFVGGSLATVLSERGVNVFQFDKAGKKSPGVNARSFLSIGEMVQHCEQQDGFSGIFLVAVPTPMNMQSGECDLSIVEGVLRELANAPRSGYLPADRIAVVKSTVLPGSTQRWNQMFHGQLEVVHSPEFLREATCLDDMRNQDRIVLGGSETATTRVEKLFALAFPGVPVIRTTSTTSEMVKYFTNVHLTSRLVLSCEFYQLCQKLSIDYNEMASIAKLDKRLGETHMQVPGPDGVMGARGHCFPKDLSALTWLGQKLGISSSLMKAIQTKNMSIIPPQFRDWEKMIGRGVSAPMGKFATKTVKPGIKIPLTGIQLPMIDLGGMGKEVMQRVFGE